MKNVTAVILAGGIGKRFVPFRHDKTLFPFMGISLIERTIEMVKQAGVTRLIIATNAYNHEWLEEQKPRFAPLEIFLHQQSQPQGMGDAMLTLRDVLPQSDILVMNAGDMVESHLLQELLAQIEGRDAMLTGLETPTYQPAGYFVLENGRAVGIKEKPGADNMPSNLANLVFHYFADAHDFTRRIEAAQQRSGDGADDVYEQALDTLMKEKNVGVYRYQGRWQKLKFGYHVLDMMEFFFKELPPQIHPSAQIAATAQVHGPVVIEEGVRVLDGATVVGPCYLGKNVIVGNGALVRGSMIEHDSTIGFGSEVVRSYVGARSELHHAYVGDSVLEEHVHFGYGAHTANYRFDQQAVEMKTLNGPLPTDKVKLGALIAQNTELGVNVTTLPGISLGSNSLIYPGTIVHAPVPDNVIVRSLQQQTTTERRV